MRNDTDIDTVNDNDDDEQSYHFVLAEIFTKYIIHLD